MLLQSCFDLLSKQILFTRPLLAVGSQVASCYSKKLSHPTPPKKNKNAWVFFFMDKYKKFVEDNPDVPSKEIFSKLSVDWRKLDKNSAEKYHKLALEDKKKYEEEAKSFKADHGIDPKSAIILKKAKGNVSRANLRAMGMPKKAPNAYILFGEDFVKNSNESPSFIFKGASKISEAWSKLPAHEKEKWNNIAAAKDKEYKLKLEEWEAEMTSKGYLEVKNAKSKNDK